MSAVNSLVPARFLTIIAHLVIVITIFWSRVSEMAYFGFAQINAVKLNSLFTFVFCKQENNVRACLPLDFTQEQYDSEDRK